MDSLKSKADELAGEEGYDSLSECFDRVLSDGYYEKISAMNEAQSILAQMYENTEMEE